MGATPESPVKMHTSSSLLVHPDAYDKPWHRNLMRGLAKLGNVVFSTLFHWNIQGVENVPKRGPLFVTPNHLSAIDVPTVGAALMNLGWEPGVTMFTIAKHDIFQKPILPHILKMFGLFPVYRNQIDLNAMRTMLMLLKRGGLIGIAAEGARSRTGHLQLFQPVVAKMAIQKHVPILPVGLTGMQNVLPIGVHLPRFVEIGIRFGPVYELSNYYDRELTSQVLEEAAWEMRAHVAELLPEWMRELPPADAEVRFGSVLSREAAEVA